MVRVGNKPTYSRLYLIRNHYSCWWHCWGPLAHFWKFRLREKCSFSSVATREPLSLLVWMCHSEVKSLSSWCCMPPTHTSATLRKNVHDPVPIKTPTSPDTSDASSPLYDQSHTEQFYKYNHHQKYIIITYFRNSFFDSVAEVVMSDCNTKPGAKRWTCCIPP